MNAARNSTGGEWKMRANRAGVAMLAFVGLLAPAAKAAAATDPIDTVRGAPDRDVRTSVVAPSSAQRATARSVGATAAWNRFGTPSSLVDAGGALATGVQGANAADAARAWLGSHAALYKLSSTRGLRLLSDSKLAGSDAHAVTFQQVVGGLGASGGGLVTIGLKPAGSGWSVVSAASTLSGDESLAGGAKLDAEQALQSAAGSVGTHRSLANIRPVKGAKPAVRGWKAFRLSGIPDMQRVRSVAFPLFKEGYVPAFETVLLDTAHSTAYHAFVDARSGRILSRESLVDNESDVAAAALNETFTGTLPATDGACDTRKGPYTVGASDSVRAIDVFADADTPAQDIILNLYRGTTKVASSDTLRTPERIRYEPSGGVPAGDYFAEVCEFPDGAPPVEPRTYHGTIDFDTSTPPAPYLARWSLFPANPPLATLARDPWNNPSTDTRQEWCWQASTSTSDCDKVIGNLASRSPWDFDAKTNTVTNTTIGNNAHTAESWTDDLLPAPTQFHPVSTTRDYTFPWTNAWNRADCNPGTPNGAAFVPGQSFDISAAVTNLFTMHNRMHDWSYLLGFTEQNWNAQSSNFGLTEPTRENDPVIGDAQSGALVGTRDNANMITLPDGSSSISNMYLWQPLAGSFYPPCVDGDYDAGVIGHEYTHMIENRTIGKGSNRTGFAAGAMGEAVGDLFSIEHVNETGAVPTDGENRYATGTYATGNKLRGIRNYAANFPYTGAFPTPSTYPQVDPLNFSDIGYDLTGPEVHADGEIWVAINFEIRKALDDKYDAQFPSSDATLQSRCAAGQIPVDQCPGNRRWIQLLFDSFLLDPTNPSMIDARNSMLAADQLRFGGADLPELRLAFARRGLGRSASGTNGPGRSRGVENDSDPLPDFEAAGQGNAPVTFEATSNDAAHTPVKARIYVGHYEARVSPIADTDPATNAPATGANNLDASALFAPGTYEFIATAPGYGAVRFRRTFTADQPDHVVIRFAPNFASAAAGARAAGSAAADTSPVNGATVRSKAQVLRALIDDTEATDWQTGAYKWGNEYRVNGREVAVDLAGSQPHTINRVQVSAMLGPVFDPNGGGDMSQNRFTALRRFEVLACNSTTANCSDYRNFHAVYTSPGDAFPADAPRPVAPMLLLRSFDIPAVQATHLRIRALDTQCTSAPAYQGEQDKDPFNATDCNSAGPAATRFVRIAEFQAFGSDSTVEDAG
jgi:hypothetical protein